MKFYDLDSLGEKQGLDNKYLLTAAVAARARSLSEQKGRTLEEDNEKFISTALQEFDLGIVRLSSGERTGEAAPAAVSPDAHVEE
jgi:DNA-directed RNA polymerase subunit K/omega